MFENIVGNDKNKEQLENIVKNGNISHSYIFSGKESIGKYMFALEFAKGILCLDKSKKPCNRCKSCIEIDNLNNPDFHIIQPDEGSIKIEQIRDMNKKILEKPIVAERKVYIINDSEKMTREAQNSLLKTLEEPPEYITIILICSNENMFLNTIKSRCVKIKFDKLKDEEIRDILKEKFGYTNISESILKIADGSIGRAVTLKDKEPLYKEIEKVVSNLKNINKIDAINCKEMIFKEKEDVNDALEYINIVFFNLINEKLESKDIVKYAKCMEIVENTKERLNRNSNFDMTIDRMLLTIWEEIENG